VTPLRQRMLEELQRRNYSSDTIRGYILAVEQFARHFHKSPERMGIQEIGQFQLHLLQEQKLALGTIALRMAALRFLYKKTLKRLCRPHPSRRRRSALGFHTGRVCRLAGASSGLSLSHHEAPKSWITAHPSITFSKFGVGPESRFCQKVDDG